MMAALGPDSSNNEKEKEKFITYCSIKTIEELKLERLQSLLVMKIIELTVLVKWKNKEYLFL